jgi:hypothetical protein
MKTPVGSPVRNLLSMLRVITTKPPSIMRADTTKKRPIMHTPQGDTHFTVSIPRQSRGLI